MDEKQLEEIANAWWDVVKCDWAPGIEREAGKDAARQAWLACYQHLAPQLMDVQRLDWMLEKSAFMVWTKRDGSILQCQAYTQDEDEEYHVLSGEHRYFNTPREAIDAARGQEKKTCLVMP